MSFQSRNLFEGIDTIVVEEQEYIKQNTVNTATENCTFEDNMQEIEEPNIIQVNTYELGENCVFDRSMSKNEIICEYVTDYLESVYNRKNEKVIGRKIELSKAEKVEIIQRISGIEIEEIISAIASKLLNRSTRLISNVVSGKISKGSITADKFDIIIKYETSKDDKLYLTKIIDLHDYKETGKGFDDFNVFDCTESSIKTLDAFSKAYPYYPNGDILVVNFEKIASQRDDLSIGEVAHTFRGYAETGYIKLINTNLNTKHNYYDQEIKLINKDALPILDRYGMIEIDFIPTRLGLFNTVKSEKEIEYNIDMIRVPETPSNIFTFADGGIGYICNGEIAQAVRSVNYTDENPTFDIYSIENIKKTGRFKENARLNKTLDNEFKSKINSKTEIKVTLLKNDIQLNSESELHTELFKYLQTKHHLLNIKGGSFMPDWDNRNDLPERMYTAETTWSEMSAETTRNEETKNEYVRRQVTVNNMKRRFSSSMNISGYEITHDGIKYSSSVANRIGRELTCKEGKTLDSETLDNMSVQQAVNLDMLHSMTKSIIVDRNNKIDKENRRMKGIIDFFFKADDGKAIKFDLLKDKEKYFINKLNNLIRKYIKSCGDRLNDVDLERLKNAIKIKDVDTKLVMIKGYIECTKLDLEEMYSNAVEKANIVINEIQNYKFANTLCMRYKERLYRIAEEYRKATGRLLEIQNFKVQITELNKEIILDNKNAIKQLNKEDRELKKLLREENKHLSRINRALNRNKLTDTMFRDYITEKTEIKIKEECNILLNISSKIINSDIQNKIEYDITKQIKLQTQLNHILDGLYEIQDGVEYSLDLLKLTNNITNINRDMFYDRYRNYVCA